MKPKNYCYDSDPNETGWCVYCDKCGAYITNIQDRPTEDCPDWTCVYCDTEEEYIKNECYKGEGI